MSIPSKRLAVVNVGKSKWIPKTTDPHCLHLHILNTQELTVRQAQEQPPPALGLQFCHLPLSCPSISCVPSWDAHSTGLPTGFWHRWRVSPCSVTLLPTCHSFWEKPFLTPTLCTWSWRDTSVGPSIAVGRCQQGSGKVPTGNTLAVCACDALRCYTMQKLHLHSLSWAGRAATLHTQSHWTSWRERKLNFNSPVYSCHHLESCSCISPIAFWRICRLWLFAEVIHRAGSH